MPAPPLYDLLAEYLSAPPEALRDKATALHGMLAGQLGGLMAGREEEAVLTSVFDRLLFVGKAFELPEPLLRRLRELNKTARALINNADGDAGTFSEKSAIAALAGLAEATTGEKAPESLAAWLEANPAPPLPPGANAGQANALIPFVRCVVEQIGPVQTDTYGRRQATLHCTIERGEGVDEGQPLTLVLRSVHRQSGELVYDYTYLQPCLHPYARLHVLDGRVQAGKHLTLATDFETLLVLEPDYLLDASELAECFGGAAPADGNKLAYNPRLYLAKKLCVQPLSPSAFSGSLVNAVLDMLMCLETLPGQATHLRTAYDALFTRTCRDNFIKAAILGRGKLTEIYRQVRDTHLPNLLEEARARRAIPATRSVLEPSYLSPIYGIAGRMDLVTHADEDTAYADVIELKSGKPPERGLWAGNAVQTVCYDLLLEGGREEFPSKTTRKGATYILYSQLGGGALRSAQIAEGLTYRRKTLELRNRLAAMLADLRQGNMRMLDALNPTGKPWAEGLPDYQKKTFTSLADPLAAASPEARAYYEIWLSFCLAEGAGAKTGQLAAPAQAQAGQRSSYGFAGLWLDDAPEKQTRYELLWPLTSPTAGADCTLTFSLNPTAHHHCMREGEIIVLYPAAEPEFAPSPHGEGWASATPSAPLRPTGGQLLRGSIVKIDADSLTVQLKADPPSADYLAKHPCWAAEPDLMEATLWATLRQLYLFLLGEAVRPGYHALLLGLQAPAAPTSTPLLAALPDTLALTETQAQVVCHAAAARDYYLLQGPPGTGKTSTVLPALLLQELALGRRNAVVLTFTTRALAEVERSLTRHGIPAMSLRRKGRTDAELEALLGPGKPFSPEAVADAVGRTRVFVCTITSFYANLEYLQHLCGGLDLLIVDEASQATEPQLCGLMGQFAKTILIGDQNQMPPVVTLAETRCLLPEDHLLHDCGITDLRQSLFERLLHTAKRNGWGHAYGMLTEHFRMHPDIAALINRYYGGLLVRYNHPTALAERCPSLSIGTEAQDGCRTLFIQTAGAPHPKLHPSEARLAAELAAQLLEENPGLTVGIISPWRAQNRQIAQALAAMGLGVGEGADEIKVDTVERFQGGERDVIIVSTALHNAVQMPAMQSITQNPDGLAVDRKLVVAVSRARYRLIILGHRPLLEADTHHYAPLLAAIDAAGGYVDRVRERVALV